MSAAIDYQPKVEMGGVNKQMLFILGIFFCCVIYSILESRGKPKFGIYPTLMLSMPALRSIV